MGLGDLERVTVESREELRAWLAAHHDQAESIWLVTFRKGAGKKDSCRPHLPWGEIVDEALCYGWIDSLPRKLDAERTMLLLSPRRPGSAWSKVNRDKVARLTEAGRMAGSGLRAVARAKADGSWDALATLDDGRLPDDLAAALAAAPSALGNFPAFPPSVRRGILEWVIAAKRPETRARRVAQVAEDAAVNRRSNQFRRS